MLNVLLRQGALIYSTVKSTDILPYDSEVGLSLLTSTRHDTADSDVWCDHLSCSVVFSGSVFSTHILAFLMEA